jgi:hypothetical protein
VSTYILSFCLLGPVLWLTVQSFMLLSRVVAPMSIGTAFAFVTAMTISITVLLSATSTTLRFRAGLIPFADYAKVRTLRIAPDQVAFLRGIMFWSVIFASLMMGLVFAIFFFLLLWQVSTCTLSSSKIFHQNIISRGLFSKLAQVSAVQIQRLTAVILGEPKPPRTSAHTYKRVSSPNHTFFVPIE